MTKSNNKIKKVCEWCGKLFEAQKSSTRYCSKECNNHAYKSRKRKECKREVETKSITEHFENEILKLKQQEYLSVIDAAKLFGVTRDAVYKLIYRGALKAFRLSSRMTVIRRVDIEAMIESRPYVRKPKPAAVIRFDADDEPEFYTTQEIMEKFGVSNRWVYAQGKARNIPRLYFRGKTLWSKVDCDRVFAAKVPSVIKEEWISYSEVKKIYNLTDDQLQNYVKYHGLRRKKEGRFAFVLKSEIDAVLKPPSLKR